MKLIDLLVQELPSRGGWPDWADVACSQFVGQIMFYRDNGIIAGDFPRIEDSCTRQEDISREQYESALAASQQQAWSGEGSPPVGTVCEFQNFSDSPWKQVTVIHYNGDEVWLKPLSGGESFVVGNPDGFRPIRTEAERKRDEAVKFMSGVFRDHVDNKKSNGQDSVFHAIYDAFKAGKLE